MLKYLLGNSSDQEFNKHLKYLKSIPDVFPDSYPLLIGSRAAHLAIHGINSTPPINKDWDLISIPSKVISWLKVNKNSIKDISFFVTPNIETNATVILKGEKGEKGEEGNDIKLDFTIPLTVQSSVAQILLYMNREDTVITPFPGGGSCRVPSVDLLITIKRGHLNYAVKWDSHVNSYHELLKHKTSSTKNTNVLSNIQLQITKEGKTLHAGKTVAPQLPRFSTDYDFSALTDSQKLQVITSLLLNYKTTFATFRAALEWACVTGPPSAADVIINLYPELVKVGDVLWTTQDSEQEKETFRTLGLEMNLASLEHLKAGSDKLPLFSFGPFTLPAELNLFILSACGWSRNLQACACVCQKWKGFLQSRKVWRQLYSVRWEIPANDKESDDVEWKKYYIKRCEDAAFWEGPNEKFKPKKYNESKSAKLLECTRDIRSLKSKDILKLGESLETIHKPDAGEFGEKARELKIEPKEFQASVQRLETVLRNAYVINYEEFTDVVPEMSRVSISLYEGVKPISVYVTCESGERGNSRHSYHCVQITLNVDNAQVVSFDSLQLGNQSFGKWNFYPTFYGHLSDKKISFLDLPSRLVIPWCLLVFPDKKKKSLLDHFTHGTVQLGPL